MRRVRASPPALDRTEQAARTERGRACAGPSQNPPAPPPWTLMPVPPLCRGRRCSPRRPTAFAGIEAGESVQRGIADA
jgi:hypothetical protein